MANVVKCFWHEWWSWLPGGTRLTCSMSVLLSQSSCCLTTNGLFSCLRHGMVDWDVVLANVWGTYQNKPSYVGGCLHYFRVGNGAGKVSVWYCCDHSYSHWFQLNHITVSHTVKRSHCKLQNWSWCVVRLTVKLNGDKYWEYVLCHVHDALLYPKWAKGGGGQTCFQGFWSLGTHWCRKPMKHALGNVVQAFWEWLCIWIQTWLAVSRRLLIWDLPLWALQCCTEKGTS